MKIGISINGVLRNYFKQIEKTHSKYFPPEEGEEGIKVLDYNLENWITFPVEESEQAEVTFDPNFDPFSSESRKDVEDLDLEPVLDSVTIDEFMYERCTLEIFGSAEEMVSNAMHTLNNLIIDYPQHDFVIMSRETGLSVPSTYFFLSKTSCMAHEVKFVTDSRDQWKFVDVMVTDHPDIIDSTPEDKTCIIVDKPFNTYITTPNIRIESIKELGDVLKSLEETVQ